MKNIIFLSLGLLVFSFNVSCQERTSNESAKSKSNKDFVLFINLFTDAKFPLNYKRALEKVHDGTVKLKDIPSKDALRYLKMTNVELFSNSVSYNYDTDVNTIEKKENLPIAHLKIFNKHYVSLIYRAGRGKNYDSTIVCFETFSMDGKPIDKIVVGEQFTKENDWMSFVALDQNHLKVFRYEVNWINFKKEGGYFYVINKEVARTTVVVIDYDIDDYGKIKKINESTKQYLRNDIFEYMKFNPNTDDIMNKY